MSISLRRQFKHCIVELHATNWKIYTVLITLILAINLRSLRLYQKLVSYSDTTEHKKRFVVSIGVGTCIFGFLDCHSTHSTGDW